MKKYITRKLSKLLDDRERLSKFILWNNLDGWLDGTILKRQVELQITWIDFKIAFWFAISPKRWKDDSKKEEVKIVRS